MNIWICKYGKADFDKDYFSNVKALKKNNPQLEEAVVEKKRIADFHFLSLHSENEKTYLSIKENSILGYSGLLIGKKSIDVDLRDVQNISLESVDHYNGQFSVFSLTNNYFKCKVDVLGLHKIFYLENNNEIYVTNYLELLKITGLLKPDINNILNDFTTNRFGVTLGYNTMYQNVYTLSEYGNLEISSTGNLKVNTYKLIKELLIPDLDFESQLQRTVSEYRIAANYLRKYHDTVVPLSGGYDGRLILNFFYKTKGRSLETMTYNRAGYLDFIVAGMLSKKTKTPHTKILIRKKTQDFEVNIPILKNPESDVFTKAFYQSLGEFYKTNVGFKVALGGNGGDTDWEFGEKQLSSLDTSSFKNFISSYAYLISNHPLFSKDLILELAQKNEGYLLKKYDPFANRENYVQLLSSSFFHMERFRQQGFGFSQYSNKYHDVFAPFGIESFNQLVFSANKKQLQRSMRKGIQYRLSEGLTNGNIPYAPILTSKNELGNNVIQKTMNQLVPYLPKIIWKLNKGDTNAKLRRKFSSKLNYISKEYILNSEGNPLWDKIDWEKIKTDLQSTEYAGKYNEIATVLKFINNNLR